MDSYANSTSKYIDKSIKNIVDVILNIDGNAKKPTFEELFKKIVTDNRDPSESILKFQRTDSKVLQSLLYVINLIV